MSLTAAASVGTDPHLPPELINRIITTAGQQPVAFEWRSYGKCERYRTLRAMALVHRYFTTISQEVLWEDVQLRSKGAMDKFIAYGSLFRATRLTVSFKEAVDY